MVYKWCIVPRCTSTSIKNPQKDFLTVPLNPKKRKMWLQLARREPTSIFPQTNVFMCEDHFDMKRVVSNYMKYKMGFSRNFLLADDAIPTKFHCQEDRGLSDDESFTETFNIKMKKRQNDSETKSGKIKPKKLRKTRKKDVITELIIPLERIEPSSHAPQQLTMDEKVVEEVIVKVEILSESDKEIFIKDEIIPEIDKEIVVKDEILSETDISCSESDLSTSEASSSTTDSASDSNVTDYSIENIQRLQTLKNTMYYIEKRPMMYIGIPKELYFLIKLVNKYTHVKIEHILLCLKKIRMNCTFCELADNFGISSPHARRIFLRDIPILSSYLQKFIVLDRKSIKNNLPIAFNNYHVSCIIDYLEIDIKKPSKVHYQALKWSDCRKGYTEKYLISCTPNGLVCFVSKGFGGRTSDVAIVENSNFLDGLETGTCILANRGFKDLEQILKEKGMTLVRPSLKADENLSNQILASLRINCKKVIRRLREFHMLKKHSVIDVNLQHVLDHVVIVACGLVNLQDSLIQ